MSKTPRLPLLALVAVSAWSTAGTGFAQWTTIWELGAPGRGWPLDGVGGGPDVDFVQEAGVNPPPGDPMSPAVAQQADDDYYFAGTYDTVLDGNGYVPVGSVLQDEIAMERAYAGADNDLRIHFNLPDLGSNEYFRFTLEPFNFDGNGADPRYGVEVYFNGNLVMEERILRQADVNTLITTDPFRISDVGAVTGPGADNVVWVRGINYNADGGGNWMGMDYHALEASEIPEPTTGGILASALVVSLLFLRGRRRR